MREERRVDIVIAIRKEFERPVASETWTAVAAVLQEAVCSNCWTVINRTPPGVKLTEVRAYYCPERSLWECQKCGAERLRVEPARLRFDAERNKETQR